MPELAIRDATPSDIPLILQFVRELAEYERALHEVEADEGQLEAALFGGEPRAWVVICELDGQAAGFALYFFNYSTWTGKYGLYLEDLYVSPAFRGSGAGKALLRYLARLAVKSDCARFEWSVLDWNAPAIAFYESFGARPKSEWIGYRLAGPALAAFAGGEA
jgi:GNAT superfamily N-acetyltransferase